MHSKLPELTKLREVVKLAQKTLDSYIEEGQAACEHPSTSLREAPFRKGILFTDAPFRVCIECGYAEEGWGSGHKKLGRNVYSGIAKLSRDEADKFVVGRIHEQPGKRYNSDDY